jgi:hypothetical protein|tara:strand:- start:408 stop:656 length:249 start_codon:yes stop_codon:yes gene_type:complete
MQNYRVSIDLSDVYFEMQDYALREYSYPFSLYILEADNPDAACEEIKRRVISEILKKDSSITARIFCRKINKYMRIDKVQSL